MFDMTPAVTRALEIAQRWARHEQTEVQPRHLLQGLLEEEEGRAWLLLTQAGLDPRQIRQPLPPGESEDTFSLDPPATSPVTSSILRRARGLSRGLGEEQSVASEHVLFAILEVDDLLRQTLESLGLQSDKLEADVWQPRGPPIQLDEPLLLDEAADVLHVGRIIDANANRAREALRVLEDYARFVLNDAFLSGELKRLRHSLAATLALLPAHLLLEARDTPGDVGTALSTPQEMRRSEIMDVVRAACKRLQEALRSLEEYGKLLVLEVATQAEALRYRAYTLERVFLFRNQGEGEAHARLAAAQLYVLVSSEHCRHSLETTSREALAGGAQMLQLREKKCDDRSLLVLARQVRQWTRQAGALFILNDRPDLARLCDADGVHLGQDDLPVREARRILGSHALIGVSTHQPGQLRQAILDGASYVGVGPVFASSTKGFEQLAGLDYLQQVLAETSVPAFAIGGITTENLAAVLSVGARRVAVSAAVCQADDPRDAASRLRRGLASQ
jgi:thiamine-phosphate pyrophosphorylase